jgi:hypothetical protein
MPEENAIMKFALGALAVFCFLPTPNNRDRPICCWMKEKHVFTPQQAVFFFERAKNCNSFTRLFFLTR